MANNSKGLDAFKSGDTLLFNVKCYPFAFYLFFSLLQLPVGSRVDGTQWYLGNL